MAEATGSMMSSSEAEGGASEEEKVAGKPAWRKEGKGGRTIPFRQGSRKGVIQTGFTQGSDSDRVHARE